MAIEKDSAVLIHYHLTNASGEVIDSSRGRDPLAYLHGHSNIVPGLERALSGQEIGAKLDVEVAPADGYGDRDPSLDVSVPMSQFPPGTHETLRPGARFQGSHPTDPSQLAVYTVLEVSGDMVSCSANHPLAGMTLHFNVQVMDVREPTSAELMQGRALQPGEKAQSSCCSNPDCDS